LDFKLVALCSSQPKESNTIDGTEKGGVELSEMASKDLQGHWYFNIILL
jgi:hypothetical protein